MATSLPDTTALQGSITARDSGEHNLSAGNFRLDLRPFAKGPVTAARGIGGAPLADKIRGERRMNRTGIILAATFNIGIMAAAFGQVAPPPPSSNPIVSPVKSGNPLDSEMDRKLQNLIQAQDSSRKQTPQEREKSQALALTDADAISKALSLSCYVDNIRIVSVGNEKTASGIIPAKVYEVSCANSMGYFMVSQKPLAPTAFSCFSAEGQRAAAAAKGQAFADICQLPENKNLNVTATKILSKAGTDCKVTKLRWFGQSPVTKLEYTEVACSNGKGYFLATALPGAPMRMGVSSCAEAAQRGMNCAFTKVTPPSPNSADADAKPTLAILKDALAQHGPACTVTNMRVIGRENVQKRHVVEFQCPEQPKGLVAFIPLGNNPNKFQTLDCPKAAKIGIVCKLAGQQ
jgi:hypothetical protein